MRHFFLGAKRCLFTFYLRNYEKFIFLKKVNHYFWPEMNYSQFQ